uniref:Uncharacterized protein n=1 Tax=Accipiter nisus TaxID=211598 RepID=A0A8B9N0F8_9AVES
MFVCRTLFAVAFLSLQNALDYLECGLSKSYSTSSHALGIDLWRGRRCCSGNLQLPPLSQRQTEKARTPDRDIVCRPTTLPLLTPPSIAITTYQDCPKQGNSSRGRRGRQRLECSCVGIAMVDFNGKIRLHVQLAV